MLRLTVVLVMAGLLLRPFLSARVEGGAACLIFQAPGVYEYICGQVTLS